MFGRKKRRGRRRIAKHRGWWSSLDAERRRGIVRRGGLAIALLTVVVVAASTVRRLEAHVEQRLLDRVDEPALTLLDLPESIAELARADLSAGVADLMTRGWVDDGLCRALAERLAAIGWVAHLDFVRRTSGARFEVGARYRLPVAMVQHGGEFTLLDGEGVRLPGTYAFDPTWKLIQGVSASAPAAGSRWPGDDVLAGLAVVSALEAEPFAGQVTGVLVANFSGRVDRRASHISLATDRAGGRIRWGSAPGLELEENTVAQKLAILRANYRQTGRLDAHHPVIDVSTFADRYTIPGSRGW